ncbi:AAEL010016-PA [Aedes aegypti]|uniref:AAEL010016-PA n=1 Tax=Aedes aegypti TaxID=7159 RepID=Q16U51_AEDAE|nr:AAEL010016-PA [Aedes aegypti]
MESSSCFLKVVYDCAIRTSTLGQQPPVELVLSSLTTAASLVRNLCCEVSTARGIPSNLPSIL